MWPFAPARFLWGVWPLIGIILAIVVGIALGLVVGTVRWLREFLEPAFEFFRAIPPPMLVPILVLLLGIGDQTKVVVIVAGAMWPVLLNTIEGTRAVDLVQRETARSYQLSVAQRIRFITLPSASPQIMTPMPSRGTRISLRPSVTVSGIFDAPHRCRSTPAH